jgi:hypothetical protein
MVLIKLRKTHTFIGSGAVIACALMSGTFHVLNPHEPFISKSTFRNIYFYWRPGWNLGVVWFREEKYHSVVSGSNCPLWRWNFSRLWEKRGLKSIETDTWPGWESLISRRYCFIHSRSIISLETALNPNLWFPVKFCIQGNTYHFIVLHKIPKTMCQRLCGQVITVCGYRNRRHGVGWLWRMSSSGI